MMFVKNIVKKFSRILLLIVIMISVTACFTGNEKTVFDMINESPAAELILPDGSPVYVDSEISSLRSLQELCLQPSVMEPSDNEGDWLYRIVFNPASHVKAADEIVVSFHQDYVQINDEFYLPENGVPYESILEWAAGKFNFFYKQ